MNRTETLKINVYLRKSIEENFLILTQQYDGNFMVGTLGIEQIQISLECYHLAGELEVH